MIDRDLEVAVTPNGTLQAEWIETKEGLSFRSGRHIAKSENGLFILSKSLNNVESLDCLEKSSDPYCPGRPHDRKRQESDYVVSEPCHSYFKY